MTTLEMLDRKALDEMVRAAGNKRGLLERAEQFTQLAEQFLAVENVAGLEVICDEVLRASDAGIARPGLRAWLDKARTEGIPAKPVRIHRVHR